MASLIKALNYSIQRDRREIQAKLSSLRDQDNRAHLSALGKVIGKRESHVENWYGSITVTVQIQGLDSFKVGPLPALLGKLIDIGVEFNRTNDYPESGNRDFCGKLGSIEIRVATWLSSASKECSVKVVSEETVTSVVKKYALCCE